MRDRVPLDRERDALARGFFAAVDRDDFAAPAERLAADVDDLRAADARVPVLRVAVLRVAVLRVPALRVADLRVGALRVPPELERDAAEPPRDEPDDPPAAGLPVISRSAASATASAMSEPSLVALAMTLVAACDAESAASRPASRIARRALGLALIAAAAAARPAASISLLIAALAILSTVLLPDEPDDREDELDERVLADFAIAKNLPWSQGKTLQLRNGSLERPSAGAIQM